MTRQTTAIAAGLGLAMGLAGGAAADTISPEIYINDTLGIGESDTIRKTVVVEEGDPTTAILDVMFLFDTTGSMFGEIEDAKTAAGSILSGLDAFGDLESGVGFYNDPSVNGLLSDLSPDPTVTTAAINTLSASGGGDFEELGNTGVLEAAGADWRPGSNRFIIALGDAGFKEAGETPETNSDAVVTAALEAEGINLLGIRFRDSNPIGEDNFPTSISELGGTTEPSAGDLVADIIASIGASFAEYEEVTLGVVPPGSAFIDVSVECVSADTGACSGALAEGDYDRSTDRTFEFDVTFTRTGAGDADFFIDALVDGGSVARERDLLGGSALGEIPVPPAFALMGLGLAGFGWLRRRRA